MRILMVWPSSVFDDPLYSPLVRSPNIYCSWFLGWEQMRSFLFFFMHSRISIIEFLVCVLGLYSLSDGSMIYVFSGTWTV